MSVSTKAMRQADAAPNVPTISESMRQGKGTGTNTAKACPPDVTSSMHQGSRKGAASPYKEPLGRTMKQGGSKKR
jgi:hypothetical protein